MPLTGLSKILMLVSRSLFLHPLSSEKPAPDCSLQPAGIARLCKKCSMEQDEDVYAALQYFFPFLRLFVWGSHRSDEVWSSISEANMQVTQTNLEFSDLLLIARRCSKPSISASWVSSAWLCPA